jgi:hypothetical protein
MTKKVYRTAQGKTVDLGSLILQNETVRAVGNMGVNARGDRVDGQNRSIDSRNQRVGRQYARQTTNVSDQRKTKSRQDEMQADEVVNDTVIQDQPIAETVAEPVVESPTSAASPSPIPEGGLAAAIAKARSIKQEPLKSPRQQRQDTPGVQKI